MKHKSPLRRVVLATLALLGFGGPAAASGCGAGFAPISQVDELRVLGVVADKPYAQPGDQVTFTMAYDDGYVDPTRPDAGPRALEIAWVAGCYDPDGDEYYACYTQPQFQSVLEGLAETPPKVDPGLVHLGSTFTLTLPTDLISQRPKPAGGAPYYGLAVVFFFVCAGQLGPVTVDGGSGLAGSFPVGCFDAKGNQLDARSFVPGYTQVYAFADGRTNANPAVTGFSITPTVSGAFVDGGDGGLAEDASVPVCPVREDVRSTAGGCGKTDPLDSCTEYQISVEVPDDVAEIDPSGKSQSGGPLYESVWVDYFADKGDIDNPILLVSDATTGIQPSFSANWIAPPGAGTVHFWAVVHDSRGGEAVIERSLDVR